MKTSKRKTALVVLRVMLFAAVCTTGCTKNIDEDNFKLPIVETSASKPQKTIVVDIIFFGAVGDGKTDNYKAFVAAAAYASLHENLTINFPAGQYNIDKYRSRKNDTITHIFWNNCKGLKLIGQQGTIISMNGTFFRPLDYTTTATGAKKSYTSGLSPFHFFHCVGLEIRNMEISGNVQNTTRADGIDENNPSVTESENNLLRFTKCDNVTIDNMYLHHAESDGMMISGDRLGGAWINSTSFTVTNVKSNHNGRQGMSVGGLSKGYFKGCEFNYNGFTDGSYGHNDPSAGVDIEPGEFHNTDNITFEDCAFESNYGGHFLCTAPKTTSNITLLHCNFFTGIETPKPQGITVLANNVLIDRCTIKLGSRTLKVTNPDKAGSTVTITNSVIEGSGNCISTNSQNDSDNVIISGNKFFYTKNVLTTNFFSLQSKNLHFLDNKIYIPAAALKSRPTGTHVLVQNAVISKGNRFYSEDAAVKPTVNYTGTKIVADLD